MAARMRQICLVASRLDTLAADFKAVLGLSVCYRDPGVGRYGLENMLMPLGPSFLEVVAPTRPGTAAGRYLERRGGDGGYMVICQVPENDSYRARCGRIGVRIANTIDYHSYNEIQLHPADSGGAMLSFGVQKSHGAEDWHPANQHATGQQPSGRARGFLAAEAQGQDPARLAERWGAIYDLPVRQAGKAFEIVLADATLRIVQTSDGRPDGLGGLDVAVDDKQGALADARAHGLPVDGDTVMIGGMRIRVV
ncbi:MAG: VOC family protein [Alphaproteobacteria bacterium]|nr:VOC family protein [Alphaproteobacteria bacterium]MCW5740859.1 VOC family protein [Alphaproteobacteria bacterium]